MRFSQTVSIRRWTAASAAAAILWCGQARAQVLEQVPSDSMAIFEVKSLEKTNAKVAKTIKAFGLDELKPELKDPLGALLETAKLTKGIDKEGDAAVAIFAPGKEGQEPEALGIIPVGDYEAFLGNFTKVPDSAAGEGITEVLDPDHGSKHLFVAHHGKYAVVSDHKHALTAKTGIKLSAAAAHEVEAKDAAFILNMPIVRQVALPELKEHRKEMIEKLNQSIAGDEKLAKFAPVINTVAKEVLDAAENFLSDADAIVFGIHIGESGITGSALIDFAADSQFGKTVAELKPGNGTLLAGLPARKYFLVGGAAMDPAVAGRLAAQWLDPVIKDLDASNTDIGKQLSGALESIKVMAGATNHSAAGWVVPTKPLGQESLVQEVMVAYGNPTKIVSAQKKVITSVNDLVALAPSQGVKTKIEFGEARTIDGAELQSYTTKFDFDANDARGMQAQQILQMIYGPRGMVGNFGVVNDSTAILAQGADDELLKELIASAKGHQDQLSDSAGIKAVSAHLPANASAVYYLALDNVVTTAVRYAQGFGLPIKMKLPENLPPIGVAIATEGSAVRVESFVPTDTVQSLIAAGIQAYTQFQGGGGANP